VLAVALHLFTCQPGSETTQCSRWPDRVAPPSFAGRPADVSDLQFVADRAQVLDGSCAAKGSVADECCGFVVPLAVEVVDGVLQYSGGGVVVLGGDEDEPVVEPIVAAQALVCSPAYWPTLGGTASSRKGSGWSARSMRS
jgi:hypothetical protein